MNTMRQAVFSAFLVLISGMLTQAAVPGTTSAAATNSIQYVPTRHDTVRDLLYLADVGTNDVVYDLGSGDGRVVMTAVRDFGAHKAVGIELDAKLVQASRESVAQAGLSNRVEIIHGDLFTNDFSPASVIVLYLGQRANIDLRARIFRSLRPGARVVSHQFGMGEWMCDKRLDVRTSTLGMYGEMWNEFKSNPDVPDFDNIGNRANQDALSAWIVPAPVAGVWRGAIRTESSEETFQVTLHQRLSEITGSFQWRGATTLAGHIQADLWGDHLRFHCVPTNLPYGEWLMGFNGHAQGDTLEGRVRVIQRQGIQEFQWLGRREKADFTGTWEWPGPSNSPVSLKMERRNGQLIATYFDENRKNPRLGWRK